MNLRRLSVGPFEVNCFLLQGSDGRSVLIDPGADAGAIRAMIADAGATVEAILLTHGHMDHIAALAELADDLRVPVWMHPDDEAWAFGPNNCMPPYYDVPRRPAGTIRPAREGGPLQVAGLEIAVMETPGHTPGGVCYHLPAERVLISGDTLFESSVGRTDLPGASSRALADSLAKLARLPPETVVWPGHGNPTSILAECRSNYFMISALRRNGRDGDG
jgi:hydroxyacylglutathione hydrolase